MSIYMLITTEDSNTTFEVFLISGTVSDRLKLQLLLMVQRVSGDSVDIPLTSFAPVNLTNVFQMKFYGNSDKIKLDNMYFTNNTASTTIFPENIADTLTDPEDLDACTAEFDADTIIAVDSNFETLDYLDTNNVMHLNRVWKVGSGDVQDTYNSCN